MHPRDEAGGRALSDLRNRGLSLAARALGQSVDHILSFFHMLRAEVAFYIGGVTLHDRLSALGHTTVIPRATALSDPRFDCQGLFDVCLAVSMNKAIVGVTTSKPMGKTSSSLLAPTKAESRPSCEV